MGFYYYFLDVYEWCLLSLAPSSQHSTVPRWGLQGGFIGGAAVLRALEMSLKGRGTRWEAFSLLPCKGLGVLQRCFAGKWMNVLQAVPGLHCIAGESTFRGVSELSRRPDTVLQSRSWS